MLAELSTNPSCDPHSRFASGGGGSLPHPPAAAQAVGGHPKSSLAPAFPTTARCRGCRADKSAARAQRPPLLPGTEGEGRRSAAKPRAAAPPCGVGFLAVVRVFAMMGEGSCSPRPDSNLL